MGNLTLSYGGISGTLDVLLDSPTSYSQVFVNGNATLAGGGLGVSLGSSFDISDSSSFTLIYGNNFSSFSFTGNFSMGSITIQGTVCDLYYYNHAALLIPFIMEDN